MKLPKTSITKKTWFIPVSILVIIFVLVGAYLFFVYTSNKQTSQPDSPQQQSTNSTKEPKPLTSGLPDNSSATTSEDVPTNESLSVSIASFSQTDGFVKLGVKTNGDGTCVVSFKPADGGKPVTKQVVVNQNTCAVDISENEFTYVGDWLLSATYYSGGQKIEAQKNVSIR